MDDNTKMHISLQTLGKIGRQYLTLDLKLFFQQHYCAVQCLFLLAFFHLLGVAPMYLIIQAQRHLFDMKQGFLDIIQQCFVSLFFMLKLCRRSLILG